MTDNSELFEFVGDTTEEVVEEAENEEVEDVEEAEESKKSLESTTEQEEEVEEEPKVKNKNVQALDSERARRKKAEAELKALKAQIENAEAEKQTASRLQSEKEALKNKLLENDLIDSEVAELIVNSLGEDMIKQKIKNEEAEKRNNFENEFNSFSTKEEYYDAENYKDEIKNLMQKGLTMEQAYFASAGIGRLSTLRKDIETEVEQKLLNRKTKAEKVDVGHDEAKGEISRHNYSKREQEIANELGIDIKDVHKRLEATSLDDILKI